MDFTAMCLGRGQGKRWIEKFKPKPVPITVEEIANSLESARSDLVFYSNALTYNSSVTKTSKNAIDIVPDEAISKDVEQIRKANEFKEILRKAVYANEFVPLKHKQSFIPADEKPTLKRHESFSCEEQAQQLLISQVMTLTDIPGEFDHFISDLSNTLTENITTEESMKESIDIIFDQAIQHSNFSYTASRMFQYFDIHGTFKVEDGQYRKVFYSKCKKEFMWLQHNASTNNKEQVCNIAILFGELFNNMKLKEKSNPLFKKVISDIVDIFLNEKSEELIRCLVRLLKLTGPELDIDRPKDVEEMFNKIREFYLDPSSASLPDSIKSSIWHVYKLHTRDWERCTSPAVEYPSNYEKYHYVARKDSTNSLIDWNDYYQGDDEIEIQWDGLEDDDHFADYEEFLRTTGQI